MPHVAGRRPSRGEQPQSLRRLTQLATLASPVVLLTGLLFYFGWVRASVEAAALGYDIGLVPLSTRDYLLKSVNVLFVPITLLLGLALGADLVGHRLLHRLVRRGGRRSAERAARLLRHGWLPAAVATVLVLAFSPVLRPYALPLGFSLAIACWYAARWIVTEAHLGGSRPDARRRLVVFALLCAALFWDTERLASAAGRAFATNIAADPTRLVSVTVLSDRDLGLTAPGLIRTVRRSGPADPVYEYTGLRLVDHSDQVYVLITDTWDTTAGSAILLRASDGVVLEFSR